MRRDPYYGSADVRHCGCYEVDVTAVTNWKMRQLQIPVLVQYKVRDLTVCFLLLYRNQEIKSIAWSEEGDVHDYGPGEGGAGSGFLEIISLRAKQSALEIKLTSSRYSRTAIFG